MANLVVGTELTTRSIGTPRSHMDAESSPRMTGRFDALPDVELARLVGAGSPGSLQALEVLFTRHSQPLYRFLMRVAGNVTEAEDLMHDVFVRVAETAASYRAESPFRTWLFSIALNLARSRQRRDAVKERATAVLSVVGRTAAENDAAELSQQRQLSARVNEAIAGLDGPERETFVLYWFGHFTYAQISAMTGVSVAAAKVRVHRTLARLSRELKGLG